MIRGTVAMTDVIRIIIRVIIVLAHDTVQSPWLILPLQHSLTPALIVNYTESNSIIAQCLKLHRGKWGCNLSGNSAGGGVAQLMLHVL